MQSGEGSWAVVTGASSGIGQDVARELARRGYSLVLVARSQDKLRQLAASLGQGIQTRVLPLDLSAEDAPERLHASCADVAGALEVLVNNAGYGIHRSFKDIPWEEQRPMLRLLVENLTRTTYLFLPAMLARGRGYILHTASTGAFQPTPTYATYAAAKSYVLSFGLALAHEIKGTGVSVSVLCPGVTRTAFQATAGHDRTTLFMRMTAMSSPRVARIGVRGLLRRRPLIVPGFMNKISGFLMKLMPRRAAATIAAGAMGPV